MSEPHPPPMEREEIERVLREAHLLQVRGSRVESMARLKRMTEQHPGEPAFWEAYGDSLAEADMLEQARDAYFQAKELRKPRLSAEKKYADIVYRIASGGHAPTTASPPANPGILALLSVLVPGVGQYMNGEISKALAVFGAWLVCLLPLVIIWRDAAATGAGTQRAAFNSLIAAIVGLPGVVILLGLIAVVIYAAVDAYSTAQRSVLATGGLPFSRKTRPAMPDASFFDEVKRELESRKDAHPTDRTE